MLKMLRVTLYKARDGGWWRKIQVVLILTNICGEQRSVNVYSCTMLVVAH
jgi:hypothetical protein